MKIECALSAQPLSYENNFTLPTSCLIVPTQQPSACCPNRGSGPMNSNTGWTLANSPYIVTSSIDIYPDVTLTIQPGVMVKMAANTSVFVNGTLLAQGTPTQPIVFTSQKDDEYGGDTNNDGNATLPAAGNWPKIQVAATSGSSSIFSNCIVRYGGFTSGSKYGAIYCLGSSPIISNTTFSVCQVGLTVLMQPHRW